jgi:hypothetical protein
MRDHSPRRSSPSPPRSGDEKIVTETYDIELGMMSFDGQFDPKALEVTRQSLKDLAILDFVPRDSALYNGSSCR